MPRTGRLDAPGMLHHIIIRGIEKKKIFRDEQDQEQMGERLGKLLPQTNTACYAWAYMYNHAHFLFRTGSVPISKLMMRLLTGYAVYFNRKHKRHGVLFQNRYKSIICQEDVYFKELVRYIHLNPLRAGLVTSLSQLKSYRYCGHGTVMGVRETHWHDTKYVLSFFGSRPNRAREKYQEYIEAGRHQGRRHELVGGGLIRSHGGWTEVKKRFTGKKREWIKSDERILGESDFVDQILEMAEESLSREAELKRAGYDLKKLERKVAKIFNIDRKEIYAKGRQKDRVACRSLYCYWAARELKVSITELAKIFSLTIPAVSYAVQRGEEIAGQNNYQLLD
jgi:REP element-mobilizing transposase RayT